MKLLRFIPILFALIVLMDTSTLTAQNSQTDSLRALFYSTTDDTNRVLLLAKISVYHDNELSDSVLFYLDSVFSFIDSRMGKAKEAEQQYFLDIKLTALNNLGVYYFDHGDRAKSLDLYFEALRIAEKLNDTIDIAMCMGNVGTVLHTQSEYEFAIGYFLKAQAMYEQIKDTVGILYILHSIGDAYSAMATDEVDTISRNEIYYQAMDVYVEVLIMAECSNVNWYKAEALLSMAYIYNYLNCNKLGIPILQLAEESYSQENIGVRKADILTLDGLFQFEVGNLEVAIELFEESITFSQTQGLDSREEKAAAYLAEVFEKQRDFKAALAMYKLAEGLKDSLQNDELGKKVIRDQMKYETGKQAAEIKVQALEIEKSNTRVFIFGMLAGVLALIIAVVIYFSLQLQKSKLNLIHVNTQLENTQIELLQLNKTKDRFFAIIAHDIQGYSSSFLGLGVMLKDYIKNEEYGKANDLVDELDMEANKLDTLIDNLLSWALTQLNKVPYHPTQIHMERIAEEAISLFAHFAEAKKIDLQSTLQPADTAYADTNAVLLIFRNLISNAIKFTNEGGRINIEARVVGKALEISVQDNGSGMDKNKLENILSSPLPESTTGTSGESGTGLGLVLCREFISINQGELRIESVPGKGSTFKFTLPILS